MKTTCLTSFGMLVFGLWFMVSCQGPQTKKNQESSDTVTKVELKLENGQYQLYCNNQPFYLKGAGLEFGNISSLKKHGGNSFRTWRVDNGKVSGKTVLDEAHNNGLLVCMGIEIARERHGFDYNDSLAVRAQFERVKKDVLELKDHPALMMWGIGNELNLHYKNPKVWDAVNEIAKMIHEIDPNHPVTTMLAGAGKAEIQILSERCPDLDLLSFQLYGDIVNLPEYLKKSGYKGAYIVSEWGATGHWEVEKTSWGRPIEQNSHVKAMAYQQRYHEVIASDPEQCIGSFVFLWGQKQERTPTWYGVFMENGDKTESVDVMEHIWTAKWPENRAPVMQSLMLDNKTAYQSVQLKAMQNYQAECLVEDPDGDELNYSWVVMREVDDSKKSEGGDFEQKPEVVLEFTDNTVGNSIDFEVTEPGEYRLFIYASDAKGSSATANIPFLVK